MGASVGLFVGSCDVVVSVGGWVGVGGWPLPGGWVGSGHLVAYGEVRWGSVTGWVGWGGVGGGC